MWRGKNVLQVLSNNKNISVYYGSRNLIYDWDDAEHNQSTNKYSCLFSVFFGNKHKNRIKEL